MMARTAAYQGHEVTWDQMLSSEEEWELGLDLEKLSPTTSSSA